MKGKERVKCALAGERADRLPRADPPWKETILRWREEGMPSDVHWSEYFDMDIRYAIFLDTTLRFPEERIDMDGEYEIVRTRDGAVVKRFSDRTGVEMPVSYPLGSAADWGRLRERLEPAVERVDVGYYGDYLLDHHGSSDLGALRETWEPVATTETYVMLNVLGPYETLLPKVGDDRLLIAMAEGQSWVPDAFARVAKMICETCQALFDAAIKPDGVVVGDDMAYKNGLLFSPAMYEATLSRPHRKLFDFFHQNHVDVFFHCDGNLWELLPTLVEEGIDAINPLEVRAGMDLSDVLEAFPGLTAMGGLLLEALQAEDVSVLDVELDRMFAVARSTDRCIYHVDHSVPPSVSLERYRHVIGRLDVANATVGDIEP